MLVRYGPGHNLPLAQKELQEALRLNPGLSPARLALADLYYLAGSYDQTIEQGGEVLKREPDNRRARLILGECLIQKGAWEAAAGAFRMARRMKPGDLAPLYGLGWIFHRKGSYPTAIRLLREAAEQAPHHPTIHYHLGLPIGSMGRRTRRGGS